MLLSFDDPIGHRPRRILVAGVSGVGKTSLAGRIATIANAPHTEIDGLFHGPGWMPRPQFLDDVRALVGQDDWVTEWQYSAVRDMLAEGADLVVWLDLPFYTTTLPRVVRRTVRRRRDRTVLWNDNVEAPLHTFFTDRDHIVRWSYRTRHKLAPLIAALEEQRPELAVVRLQTPQQVEAWLAGALAAAVG